MAKKLKPAYKMYIVTKRIYARSAAEAINRDRRHHVDDCYVDTKYLEKFPELESAIGFTLPHTNEDEY